MVVRVIGGERSAQLRGDGSELQFADPLEASDIGAFDDSDQIGRNA
ncbi:hypothetical protein [Salinibacterium sp. PAMC 21357]|nr:hypothetical protein [Salinibacterium sp. PAMC 21357]